ncbi:MAG: acyl-[acyl-carrier-protein]--UDP-N-acetylglucosamine O-acyltransferase [Planctomycetaceae bacterium]|nr:acyl-[acyl-carrier-protein]--UDP-N-acetylglucosamine O-acyltransferase [Planctomycetaceae bacterium]
MSSIHPTAIIDSRVELAEDVEIGPYCVLEGAIRIGRGTRLRAHCFMQGPLVIGEENDIWPFSSLGVAPQTSHFDPAVEGPGTIIGDRNVFREHASVHRSIHETDPTRIGDDNLFMDGAHAGHDCQLANHIVLAKGSMLGGHAIIEDRVIIGGNAGVHQFVRVGRGVMIGGNAGSSLDVPPWFMVTLLNNASSINLIGLRRSGASAEDIAVVRMVHKLFCRSGLSIAAATERLQEEPRTPMVEEYLSFLERSTRSICTMRGRKTEFKTDAAQPTDAS